MAKPLEIEGFVEAEASPEDRTDSRRELQRLEDEIRSLRRQNEDLCEERDRLKRSIEHLRTMLSPLHRALRAIFGEIALSVGEEQPMPAAAATAVAGAAAATSDPRWASFKNSFPGVGAEIIDALLIHGTMKISHMGTLLKRHHETVRTAARKLRDAGAINISNATLSLR